MRASVVIASRNRRRHLQKCLECLCHQDCSPDAYEIIVVDDASTDDTWSMLEGFRGPCRIRKIRLPERVGQAIARNQAIEVAAGEVIIFIDDDAFACPGFICEHLVSHQRSPMLIVDGPAINFAWKRSSDLLPFESKVVRAQSFMDFAGACFVTVNTSCRREHLLACGGFDPDFSGTYGWEDTELGLRLRKMGLRRLKNRSAFVLHCACGPAADVLLLKRRQCGSNAILYYRKHPELSVRREIRLGQSRRLPLLNSLCRFRWPMGLLLHREYAMGLREGIERYGLPEIEVRR